MTSDRATKRPLRLLAVVDGTERTNRVLDHVVALAQGRAAAEVVILNVQEKREDGRLRGYQSFKGAEIDDRLVNELGAPIVGSAGRWLDKAGVANRTRVQIGEPVATILRCATEHDCDAVVVGERRPGGLRRWLAGAGLALEGSVAGRLVMLAEIPVVVVK